MAASKTKKFTSEVLLTQNKNVLTIKTGSTVTNFNIYLGESGEEVTSPVIKPVAVISVTPEQGITTSTTITWGYENSTTVEGRTIVSAEWEGKQDIYSAEGTYTVRLRVQDSTGVWSDWVEKTIIVEKSANRLSRINYTTVYKSSTSKPLKLSHGLSGLENTPFVRVSENELRRYTLNNSSPAYLQRIVYDKDMNVLETLTYTQFKNIYDYSVFRYNGNDYLVHGYQGDLYLLKFNETEKVYEEIILKELPIDNYKCENIVTAIDGNYLYVFYDWYFNDKEYLIKYDLSSQSIVAERQVTVNNSLNQNGLMAARGTPSMTLDENYIYLAMNTQYSDTRPANVIVFKISKDTLLTDEIISKLFSNIRLYQPEIFFDGSGQLWLFVNAMYNDHQISEGLYTLDFTSNTMKREISYPGYLQFTNLEVMPDGTVRVYKGDGYMSYFIMD